MTAQEQLAILKSGVNQVHSEAELLAKLEKNRPLKVKLGFDPSSPDLHLGHAVVLDKVRQFQELGHQAIIIVGDTTARIGDPTGKSKTRPPLEPEAIEANAKTYTEQVFKVIEPERTQIRRNGEWFDHFTYADVLKLNARISVARLLERDDFQKRYREGTSITLTEFQYPLMQGWDSVMIEADVELGGNDQLFNNLVGRDLQRSEAQEPQVVMVMPILTGTDGVEKMSKSLGNTIGLTDAPEEMFGKTMSISDETMHDWWAILDPGYGLGPAPDHPMDAKKHLAGKIVQRFHGPDGASEALNQFELKFSKKSLDDAEIESYTVPENPIWIGKLLQEAGAVKSGGEARRLIQQGGVKIDGEKFTDPKGDLHITDGMILQSGKKFFRKLYNHG